MRISVEESSFLRNLLIGFLFGTIGSIIILTRLVKKINHALRHTSDVSKQVFQRLLLFSNDSSTKSETNFDPIISTDRSKAWVYQLIDRPYDSLTFSLSMTSLCLIVLRRNILFILRTTLELDRKLTDDELETKATLNQIDIYNLNGTIIGLLPTPMTRSKYWSKKNPLIVEKALYLGNESIKEGIPVNFDLLAKKTSEQYQRKTLQFFTRTRRSKEEWFYRLINASQLDSWRDELNHRVPTDFLSEKSSMSSTRETTEIRKSFVKKTDANYRQRILQFLGTNDRFSTPTLFARLKSINVREEHRFRFDSKKMREELSRRKPKNNNLNTRHLRDQKISHSQSDDQWLFELDDDHTDENDLVSRQEKHISELSSDSNDGMDNQTDVLTDHNHQSSLPHPEKSSALLYFVLTYLGQCSSCLKMKDYSSPLLLINIFAARCFLDLFDNEYYLQRMRIFIQKQLDKIHIPFIEHLTMADLHLGDRLPEVQDIIKPWIDEHGLWFSMKTIFDGKVQFTITAKLRWHRKHSMTTKENQAATPLSDQIETNRSLFFQTNNVIFRQSSKKKISWRQRLCPSSHCFRWRQHSKTTNAKSKINNVNNSAPSPSDYRTRMNKAVLAINFEVRHIDGILLFNIPPIPSDRLWISFLDMPDMQFSAIPRLGQYRVSFSKIKHRLERKFRQIFRRHFVMPNMKDLIIPTANDYLVEEKLVEHYSSESEKDQNRIVTTDEGDDDDIDQ